MIVEIADAIAREAAKIYDRLDVVQGGLAEVRHLRRARRWFIGEKAAAVAPFLAAMLLAAVSWACSRADAGRP